MFIVGESMKKIFYILLVIISIFMVNVKADDDIYQCEKEEKQRLKDLASKLEYTYDYRKDENDVINFSITISNMNEDLKILITDNLANGNKEFKYNDTKKSTLSGFSSGQKVNLAINGFVVNWCSGVTIATKQIKLPYYNYNYDEEFCKDNSDFKYCKQLLDTKITQEEYDSALKKYLSSKEKGEEPTKIEDKEESNWNLLIIIGSIVGVLIIIVTVGMIVIKRRRKSAL